MDNPLDYATRRKPKGSARSSPDGRDTLYARQPAYVTLAHIQGLTVDGLHVLVSAEAFQAYKRSALSGTEIEDALLRDVNRKPTGTWTSRPPSRCRTAAAYGHRCPVPHQKAGCRKERMQRKNLHERTTE